MALCALAITIYKNTQTHSEAEVKSKSEKHHGTTKKHIQSRIDTHSLSHSFSVNLVRALSFERICINGTAACITRHYVSTPWLLMPLVNSIVLAFIFLNANKRSLSLAPTSILVVYLKTSCPLQISNSRIT